jgi:hypothetical protein
MLRVTVELVPEGDVLRTSTIGVMRIVNEHNVDGLGFYEATARAAPRDSVPAWRKMATTTHDRADNVWRLVLKSLQALEP